MSCSKPPFVQVHPESCRMGITASMEGAGWEMVALRDYAPVNPFCRVETWHKEPSTPDAVHYNVIIYRDGM